MRDVLIIGSGPAGLTAALYAARANLKPLLIEGLESGGQLMLTTAVENYPGFRDGVMGPDLMAEMRAQAERFGTEFMRGDIVSADLTPPGFAVATADDTYRARTLIIATGASARLLGLPSERTLMGHGVSTCATCDGYFFRDKPIAVVGGGDSAMEEATFLTKFASHVTVVHRRDTLRASKIMQDKALANPKISFEWNAAVQEVTDTQKGVVTGIVLRDVNTGRAEAPGGRGRVRRHRTYAEHPPVQGPDRARRRRLHRAARRGADERCRRLRGRRRAGPRLSAGDHRRRVGLHGGDRRRALPREPAGRVLTAGPLRLPPPVTSRSSLRREPSRRRRRPPPGRG